MITVNAELKKDTTADDAKKSMRNINRMVKGMECPNPDHAAYPNVITILQKERSLSIDACCAEFEQSLRTKIIEEGMRRLRIMT